MALVHVIRLAPTLDGCVLIRIGRMHAFYAVVWSIRRRGGIEPLHISVSLELKSSPSTNLTNPGSRGTG